MIVVRVIDTGDEAEASSPEAALLAARTMGREAADAKGIWGYDPTIAFSVGGVIVRSATLRSLNREAR